MAFDPSMTYWQSLRIVASGLIQWPFRRDDWEPFIEGVKDVFYYGLSPFARLAAMLLLPITAPLFTWLVQKERKRIAAAKARLRAGIHQNGPGAP